MYISIITILIAMVAVGIPVDVNASGLSITDFADTPERICVSYGDEPGMESVCDWIDVCDDEGASKQSFLCIKAQYFSSSIP